MKHMQAVTINIQEEYLSAESIHVVTPGCKLGAGATKEANLSKIVEKSHLSSELSVCGMMKLVPKISQIMLISKTIYCKLQTSCLLMQEEENLIWTYLNWGIPLNI